MNRKPGYGAQLRANLDPTKGVGRLRQQDGGHGSRNPLRRGRARAAKVVRGGWVRTLGAGGRGPQFRGRELRAAPAARAVVACRPGTDWERLPRGPSPGVSTQNWYGQGESDCLIKTKHCDGPCGCSRNVISANVKVKKFNQARVNGGSNYDSLKVAKCYRDSTVPVYYPAKPQPRERAWRNQRGKKTLLSLTLVRLCEMTERWDKWEPKGESEIPLLLTLVNRRRGTAPLFGPRLASAGRSGRKTLSVRIRTVKAWPNDPLDLRNLKLAHPCSQAFIASFDVGVSPSVGLFGEWDRRETESGLEATHTPAVRLPTRSPGPPVRWPSPRADEPRRRRDSLGDPSCCHDPLRFSPLSFRFVPPPHHVPPLAILNSFARNGPGATGAPVQEKRQSPGRKWPSPKKKNCPKSREMAKPTKNIPKSRKIRWPSPPKNAKSRKEMAKPPIKMPKSPPHPGARAQRNGQSPARTHPGRPPVGGSAVPGRWPWCAKPPVQTCRCLPRPAAVVHDRCPPAARCCAARWAGRPPARGRPIGRGYRAHVGSGRPAALAAIGRARPAARSRLGRVGQPRACLGRTGQARAPASAGVGQCARMPRPGWTSRAPASARSARRARASRKGRPGARMPRQGSAGARACLGRGLPAARARLGTPGQAAAHAWRGSARRARPPRQGRPAARMPRQDRPGARRPRKDPPGARMPRPGSASARACLGRVGQPRAPAPAGSARRAHASAGRTGQARAHARAGVGQARAPLGRGRPGARMPRQDRPGARARRQGGQARAPVGRGRPGARACLGRGRPGARMRGQGSARRAHAWARSARHARPSAGVGRGMRQARARTSAGVGRARACLGRVGKARAPVGGVGRGMRQARARTSAGVGRARAHASAGVGRARAATSAVVGQARARRQGLPARAPVCLLRARPSATVCLTDRPSAAVCLTDRPSAAVFRRFSATFTAFIQMIAL
ncbi:UNVERIFIED_CONTAM: hypothetical protein Sradi_7112900 [Sesamum radiatum]|uniref:Uncharacterized protein n=1 Tax=Sesamum radiatum TaxID=300843 RepID=A0AAW2J1K9_SESRA